MPRTTGTRRRAPRWRSTARSSPELAAALEKLGKRIKKLREGKKLSQEEAAERAELSGKHWQDIEGGRTNPTYASLIAVARSLGVPLSKLVERI